MRKRHGTGKDHHNSARGKGCGYEIGALSCTTKKEMRPHPAGVKRVVADKCGSSDTPPNLAGINDRSHNTAAMTDMTKNLVDDLRKKAEALLEMAPNAAGMLPAASVKELLHELQVHQIELELQNEELRNTRNALEESRSLYMQLYHNAPVGYVVLDKSGVVSKTNVTFANMVHRDRAQILGRHFGDFIHADDRPVFFARSKAFFKNPADKTLELRINTPANAPFYVRLQVARQHHLDEKTSTANDELELLLTVTDITDRVAAEKALIESEQFARSTVDALSANIAILDETGRIIAVNQAWREFAGASQTDPETISEGANYIDLCHSVQGTQAEAARKLANGIVKVINGEMDVYSQEYACHAPEKNAWFSGMVTRFPAREGKRVVVAHENITERKQLETENLNLLRRLNQMEKEDSLGRMAGAIAHHFNNQLFVILGNIELALENAPHDPMLQQSLLYAQEGTNKAAEISGKMLTYLGLTIKDRAKVDLSAICRRILPRIRAIKPDTATLHANFPASGPTIVANENQIEELLDILVENAWESRPDRPCDIHLSIDTAAAADIAAQHRFPLAWKPRETIYACLQVADNGSGIAEEHLERIFDPFYSNKFMGRGMGLPLVLGILRAHKGCVTVTSKTGQGTTIRVYFPLVEEITD
jgi:two-component system, sensor histidine kinase